MNGFVLSDVYGGFAKSRTVSPAHNVYIFQIAVTDGAAAFLRVFIATYRLASFDITKINLELFRSVNLISWVLSDFNYQVMKDL